jgi:hypothetical protein
VATAPAAVTSFLRYAATAAARALAAIFPVSIAHFQIGALSSFLFFLFLPSFRFAS